MHERILENWLDNAGERSFQIPYSHSLAADGYRVIHVSRHCGMELGKDILALSPKGVPCAFQLKGVKGKELSLSQWRSDLEQQLTALVCNAIVHPSIPSGKQHQAYIVVNGTLAEEVAHSIEAFNRNLPKGYLKLKTVVKGELLEKFRRLGSDFWPPEISTGFKTILELILADGRGLLDKCKLSMLLSLVLQLEETCKKRTDKKHAARLASVSILTSYVTSSFQAENNHVAEFEALTQLYAHILAYSAKHSIAEAVAESILGVTSQSMLNCLGRLCDELISNEKISSGEPLSDRYVYPHRLTWLVGLMALYGLWNRTLGTSIPEEHLKFVSKFIPSKVREMRLWGESASPFFFLAFLFWRLVNPSPEPEGLLVALVNALSSKNSPHSTDPLASPYHSAESVLLSQLKVDLIDEDFSGGSYSLEGFLDLLVRANRKQTLRSLWPQISRVDLLSFVPEPPWRAAQWRSPEGVNYCQQQPLTRLWSDLVESAMAPIANSSSLFNNHLGELLAFIAVYPHRFSASSVRLICNAYGYGWHL